MEIWWDRQVASFQSAIRRDVRREVLREKRWHQRRQVRLIRHLKSKIVTLQTALAAKEAEQQQADQLIWELKETVKSCQIALDYYRERFGG